MIEGRGGSRIDSEEGGRFWVFPKTGHSQLSRVSKEPGAVQLLEPGHTGRTYVITGPEALTYRELAAKLSAATGRPVRYVDVTPAQAKQSMMAAGMPEWAADAVNELSAWYRSGHGALVTQVVAEIGGRTPHTFDTFARDHAAAFRGG
jgi:uncharacterized protein YbjT (DUF2867 family)